MANFTVKIGDNPQGSSSRRWQAVAALVDPVRRALYEFVRGQRRPVTREQAADAVDVSRNLAAFHLEKLVEVGMLQARYEAPAQPRGRGRTPKVYEATSDGLTLTVPQRHYDLAGTILADAIATDPADARQAANRHAAYLGHYIGSGIPREGGPSPEAAAPGDGDTSNRALRALADLGYEPHRDAEGIVVDNCPFHALATRHTALICGINVEFVSGLLAGLECFTLRAELRPRFGGCCVYVRTPSGALP